MKKLTTGTPVATGTHSSRTMMEEGVIFKYQSIGRAVVKISEHDKTVTLMITAVFVCTRPTQEQESQH